MKSISGLKMRALLVNRVCYILILVFGVFMNIGMYGLYYHYIHDAFDTYYSTARRWGVVLIILGIASHVLFTTLGYYLIKLFIQTRRNEVEE